MKRGGFVLSREEIARQIHLLLSEIYPERRFAADVIDSMITQTDPGKTEMVFRAAAYARIIGLDKSDLLDRLFRELEIQIEKNVHDKYLFEMLRNKDSIFFKAGLGDKND